MVGLGAGRRSDVLLTPDERRLLDALTDQAAVAIERVYLAKEMDDARVAAEAERLRSALLTSLSHDLKTPLASIVGAATSLCDYGERLDAKGRLELAKTIEEEGARMTRFVSNLLDMTRLEAGAVRLTREPTDIPEIIGTAMRRTEKLLKSFKVDIEVDPDLPLLPLDQLLMEQVLVNLLDNAAKYAPPSSLITVRARRIKAPSESGHGRGAGHSREPARLDLRKISSRLRSSARRNRAGTGDLPRLPRSDGRRHRGRQPHGPNRRYLYHRAARGFCGEGKTRGGGLVWKFDQRLCLRSKRWFVSGGETGR